MPVTLTAPGTKEKIEVLSTTDVVAEVQERVPWPKFHENYLKKLTDKGNFPEPWIEIGGRKGWLRQDVAQWIEERAAGAQEKRDEEILALLAGKTDKELEQEFARLKKKLRAR